MDALTFALISGLGALGILAVVLGYFAPPGTGTTPGTALSDRLRPWWAAFSPAQRIAALAGLVVGIVIYLVSHWVVALVAAPALAIVVPVLLGDGASKTAIARLEAIESWTRALSSLITTGTNLEQAITLSLTNTPAALREPISRLVARINARWPITDALQSFADDLNDPTGDLVVAHLQLAAKQRGPGLSRALDDLAGDVFEEVRVRREIEADRSKPLQSIRIITYVTLVLFAAIPFAGQFFQAYGTPLGQLLLAGWIAVYAILLVLLKRSTTSRATPRILKASSPGMRS